MNNKKRNRMLLFIFLGVALFALSIFCMVCIFMEIDDAFTPICFLGSALACAYCVYKAVVYAKMEAGTFNYEEAKRKEKRDAQIKEATSNEPIVCPHCGSEHLTYQKKGFSEVKALIGMTLIGVWGVMFGVPGKDKIKATCLKCGHSFMIKKI